MLGPVRRDRYRRFRRVGEVGSTGPEWIGSRSALIVGIGALGSVAASALVRAGVGTVVLVDRDVVEESNLTDQSLFIEADATAARPKAEVAAQRLATFNRHVDIRGRVLDFSSNNAEALADAADVIVDASDNLPTKYLINDVAVSTGTPWIYGGCAGRLGMVMTVVPGRSHCMRCLWPEPPRPVRVDGCESMGLLPATASIVGSLQATEALKILLNKSDEVLRGLNRIDAWSWRIRSIPIPTYEPSSCSCCGDRAFPYLEGSGIQAPSLLCGGDTVLIAGTDPGFDYSAARSRLTDQEPSGDEDFFRFAANGYRFLVFRSGRTLVHGTNDPREAQSLYARFLLP
jgi:molybdopterin/thiamine biosynthesis adenylyltransferase